jgi:hypothetical protein
MVMVMVAVLVGVFVVQGVNLEANVFRLGSHSTMQGPVVSGGGESNPSSPIRIKLGISNPPPLGKTAELVAVVTSAMDAANVEVHIAIPKGFTIISGGSPDWRGSVSQGRNVELRYVIKSVEVGDWVIEGSVKWTFDEGGSFYTDTDKISLSVSENAAYVTTRNTTDTTNPPAWNETNPPPLTEVNPPAFGNETIPPLGNETVPPSWNQTVPPPNNETNPPPMLKSATGWILRFMTSSGTVRIPPQGTIRVRSIPMG